jgi:TniQ
MLPRERAEQILTLNRAGWSVRAIADHLGHSQQTIRAYINGRTTPGTRVPRQSLLTERLANYCHLRLAEDPNLRLGALFKEVADLGFKGSRSTFYRELAQRRPPSTSLEPAHPHENVPHDPAQPPRSLAHAPARTPVLPRPVAPVTGETLVSYLTRLARTNHLTISEVLAVLPSWFATKINNRDDRAQHHMLAPATARALYALAHLAGATPTGLAHALPAFATADTPSPARATTACHRCTARRGIHQPIPVHLPIHLKVCARHGIWLSDLGQPHLDIAACPEIINAQHRADRLLQRYTPQQLALAHQAAASAIPPWPTSPAAIPLHWRHRLLVLQTTNQHRSIPARHDTYTHAAIYPNAIELAAAILNPNHTHPIQQDPLAHPIGIPDQQQP